MNKEELFKKHNEMLDKGKEETEKWILSLSDEEFKLLCQLPIISQEVKSNNLLKGYDD